MKERKIGEIRWNDMMPFGKYINRVVSDVMYADAGYGREYLNWWSKNVLDCPLSEAVLATLDLENKKVRELRDKVNAYVEKWPVNKETDIYAGLNWTW